MQGSELGFVDSEQQQLARMLLNLPAGNCFSTGVARERSALEGSYTRGRAEESFNRRRVSLKAYFFMSRMKLYGRSFKRSK